MSISMLFWTSLNQIVVQCPGQRYSILNLPFTALFCNFIENIIILIYVIRVFVDFENTGSGLLTRLGQFELEKVAVCMRSDCKVLYNGLTAKLYITV